MSLFVLESNTNRTIWDFPFIWPVGLLFPPGGGFCWVVLGGNGGVKFGKAFLQKLGSALLGRQLLLPHICSQVLLGAF